MKLRNGSSWLVVSAAAVGLFLLGLSTGCSPAPEKKSGKKGEATKKAGETRKKSEVPVVKPEEPGKPEEPSKPDEPKVEKPAKPDESAKPDEPAKKDDAPKPDEPKVEKPAKPDESAKPDEPAKKDDAPKPDEPKVEKPAKPDESAKPDEPAKKDDAPKPDEPKVEKPAKPDEPSKPDEPAKKDDTPKPDEPKVEKPAKPDEPAKTEKKDELAMADSPAKPAAGAGKISGFAPAEDLVSAMDKHIQDLEKATVNEEEYKDQVEGKFAKEGNAVILVALALGMHDQENKYKANAAALMEAAQKLASAKDYDSAKKGVEALAAAAKAEGKGSADLTWSKADVVALPDLMKYVPTVSTRLRTLIKKLPNRAKDSAAAAAEIAVIGQGSLGKVSSTKKPDEGQKWQEYCAAMRDAAGSVNTIIHAGDKEAVADAMKKLQKSCDDCHDVFSPESKGKDQ